MDLKTAYRTLAVTGALLALAGCSSADNEAGPASPVATDAATTTAMAGNGTGTTTSGTTPPRVREALDRLCGRLSGIGDAFAGVNGIDQLPQALDRSADQLRGVEEDLSAVQDAASEPRSPQVQDVVDATKAGVDRLGDAARSAVSGNMGDASRQRQEAMDKFDDARAQAAELGADRCTPATGTTTAAP